MKKTLSLLILLTFPVLIFSKNIEYQNLIRYGQKAYQQRISVQFPSFQDEIEIKNIDFFIENGDTLMAAFNFSSGGFIILSADDAAYPVIAYSIDNQFDIDNIPPALEDLLLSYKQQIMEIKRLEISGDVITTNAWNNLRGDYSKSSTSIVVNPLITARWNQNKYYNAYSPIDEESPDGYDGKVPNGCVAVAMAMIMYYYRFPESGQGSHTNYNSNYDYYSVNFAQQNYRYDMMSDQLTSYNNEVAKLIFHCATSVDMMYSPAGSGAYSDDAARAFKNYFKYSNSASYITRNGYSTNNWISVLINELNNKRPLYYSGYSNEGGHAFVCDGYDSDTLFHFNFGWGGSGNGYFTVRNLNGAVGGYYMNQGVIRNIYPSGDYPTYCPSSSVITAVNGTLEDGSNGLNYLNNSNCQYIIAPENASEFTINIRTLKTELNHDTLSFWKGNPTNGQLVATYSGIVNNRLLSIVCDSLYITFKTNDSINDEGWKLDYTVTQNTNFCSYIRLLTAQSGTFDDGSGDNQYAANSECTWIIRPANLIDVEYITLTFLEFDISAEDELIIYDNHISPPVQMGIYNGNTAPQNTTTYNTNRLKIVFRSDNYLQKNGFTAHWETNLSGIESYMAGEFSIFPNPARDYFRVRLPGNTTSGEYLMTIYDITGKVVQKQTVSVADEAPPVNISSLSEGFYIISLNNQYHTYSNKLIIKR